MGSLDPAKILVILMIALVLLGPERLPRAALHLGRAWRELTRMRDQVVEEVRHALPDELTNLPRPNLSVSRFLADLTMPEHPEAPADASRRDAPVDDASTAIAPAPRIEMSVTADDPSMN